MNACQDYIPLVDVYRGRLIESVHFGALVVADAKGRVLASLGSPDLVTYPRSSLKPFQAVELVQSGAADAIGLDSAIWRWPAHLTAPNPFRQIWSAAGSSVCTLSRTIWPVAWPGRRLCLIAIGWLPPRGGLGRLP